MIVLKFGGSSIGSAKNIRKVKDILSKRNKPFIAIISAASGATDQLQVLAKLALEGKYIETLESLKMRHFNLLRELLNPANQPDVIIYTLKLFNQLENICNSIFTIKELSDKTLSYVLSFGERLSICIIHKYLIQEGIDIDLLDSKQLIKANHCYLNAKVNYQETEALIKQAINGKNYIATGFIASNNRGEYVVLGRGGSDYSAAIYASAINAKSLELWSDVNGMLNANPKIVQQANSIDQLSYKEAFELAYFGAKVLYPAAIRPVMQKNIPVYLKNTLHPEQKGTLISFDSGDSQNKIKGVASLPEISLVTVSGVGLAGTKGSARKVFQALEEAQINIILITQSCSEQGICFGINNADVPKAVGAINQHFKQEMECDLINPVEVLNDHVIIAVVGDNMRHKVGLSGKIFGALGENGINVIAIAQGASERNISIVVNRKDEIKAVNVIHERFFQKAIKKIHLFIAGVGNVGSEFLQIVFKQQQLLYKDYQIDLKITGVANSKKMLLDTEGLTLEGINSINEKGALYQSFNNYIEALINLNLRNSVFIDNTASEIVSKSYESLLKNSISIVACNKIASSSPYKNYRLLIQLAKERNCNFQFETSVGAALPIIKTIRDLLLSGDKIHKIQAVLSGSLNFIFNNYNAQRPFADIVLQAKNEGFTEPNPQVDLNGLDVMRKILILARETGNRKELDDVQFNGFLPENCINANGVEQLFEKLKKEEPYFKRLYRKAHQNGNILKVMAVLENGELFVSLKEISPDSVFYNLGGKDNIVALFTDRYNHEPLIIKGAGAGAEVTASGVFSDLMYIINR